MSSKLCSLFLLMTPVVVLFSYGCNQKNDDKTINSLKDVPLEPYQYELLDLAFSVATAMPVYPHIKNRSRTQEVVVKACLELNQPLRALRYIKKIDNWRRGIGYADLAFYCAKLGFENEAESFLNMAVQISEKTEDWRKDRIKVKISEAYTYLGNNEEALKFKQNIEAFESGKVAQVRAMICPTDAFDEEMKNLQKLVSTKNFDIVKNALDAYTELYNRFYADAKRRALVEEKMRASWRNLPISIRLELLIKLVDFSLTNEDKVKALKLVSEAEEMMDSVNWQLRFRIPLMTRLAELRFRAGDTEQARTELQDTPNIFDTNREKIVNIYRAQILRSIAEAYQTMGEPAIAHDLYKRTLEAGIENPNSRPRAEDLTATCCSMALHAVEPGTELLNRIREIHDGLGDPW